MNKAPKLVGRLNKKKVFYLRIMVLFFPCILCTWMKHQTSNAIVVLFVECFSTFLNCLKDHRTLNISMKLHKYAYCDMLTEKQQKHKPPFESPSVPHSQLYKRNKDNNLTDTRYHCIRNTKTHNFISIAYFIILFSFWKRHHGNACLIACVVFHIHYRCVKCCGLFYLFHIFCMLSWVGVRCIMVSFSIYLKTYRTIRIGTSCTYVHRSIYSTYTHTHTPQHE